MGEGTVWPFCAVKPISLTHSPKGERPNTINHRAVDSRGPFSCQILFECSSNQLLELCMVFTVWSDPVIRPVSVHSSKFTTGMEKQRKTELSGPQNQ